MRKTEMFSRENHEPCSCVVQELSRCDLLEELLEISYSKSPRSSANVLSTKVEIRRTFGCPSGRIARTRIAHLVRALGPLGSRTWWVHARFCRTRAPPSRLYVISFHYIITLGFTYYILTYNIQEIARRGCRSVIPFVIVFLGCT